MSKLQTTETPAHAIEPAGPFAPAGHEDGERPGWLAAEGGGPAAILDKINKKLPHGANSEEALARRCNCMSVWCRNCYRRHHQKRHYDRMVQLPWEETRLVTLTLDPKIVGEKDVAFFFLRMQKPLGRFFQKLERKGVIVKDWCGQLEWQKNGNPHYHLLVRTQKGPRGKIGNQKLREAWGYGSVREDYFKTRKDYDKVVGYFGKAGYFHKGHEYQTVLPDYCKEMMFNGIRIQRFYSARKVGPKSQTPRPPRRESLYKSTTNTKKAIEQCGRKTVIFYFKQDGAFDDFEEKYLMVLDVPYSFFKVILHGWYQQKRGFRFYLNGVPPEIPPCPI